MLKYYSFIIISIFSILCINISLAEQIRQIPLEDFFKNPEKTNVKISPNGQNISYLADWNNRLNIFIQNLENGEIKQITHGTKQVIHSYFWASDDKIVYLQDFDGNEKYHLYLCNLNNQMHIDLTPQKDITCITVDKSNEVADYFLFLMGTDKNHTFDLYTLDLKNNKISLVAKNPGNITDYLIDEKGQIRACTTVHGLKGKILYRKNPKRRFYVVKTFKFPDWIKLLSLTDDKVFISSTYNHDTSSFCELDINTATEKYIFNHPEVDIQGVVKSKKRNKVTAIKYTTDKTQYKFLDEQQKKIQTFIDNSLPQYTNTIVSSNKEENKLIIYSSSDKTLGAYYLFDINNWQITKLFEVSPWLKEEELSSMQSISYIARDGLKIHGYLTLPKNKPAKNLPLIICPHGGPWARTYKIFRPDVQFLANRGYAVLIMDFRGSIGYGKNLYTKGFKQWGLNIQNDITDGVMWAINQGIADPQKIAILGGSFGGYSALCGIIQNPKLYAAAIDYVGVTDLLEQFGKAYNYNQRAKKIIIMRNGDIKKDKQQLIKTSPIHNVDKIKTPLFVVHGANDRRVDISQSKRLVKLMQEKNIPVEYMFLENEGHGFRKEENKFEFYKALEDFLNRHLDKSCD